LNNDWLLRQFFSLIPDVSDFRLTFFKASGARSNWNEHGFRLSFREADQEAKPSWTALKTISKAHEISQVQLFFYTKCYFSTMGVFVFSDFFFRLDTNYSFQRQFSQLFPAVVGFLVEGSLAICGTGCM